LVFEQKLIKEVFMRFRNLILVFALMIYSSLFIWPEGGGGGGGGGSNSIQTKINDEEAKASFDKGVEYSNKGDYENAIIYLRKSVDLNPLFPEAYNMLGFSLRKSGKFEEAVKAYKRAISMRPKFAEAHEYLGEAYLQMGKRDDAWKEYLILEKLKSDEAKELLEKIEEFDKKNK